jgi:hypothetical protein
MMKVILIPWAFILNVLITFQTPTQLYVLSYLTNICIITLFTKRIRLKLVMVFFGYAITNIYNEIVIEFVKIDQVDLKSNKYGINF